MSSLAQVKQGLNRLWGNLAEGWQNLRDRASEALTRFHLVHHADSSVAINDLYKRTSRWGLLAAEVEERDKDILVRLEAPGMEASDFDISIVENYVVVRGEKQLHHEKQNGRFHILECAYGQFERAIPLPVRVDEEGTKAKYKHGVLSIQLPKHKQAVSRRIKIVDNPE